MYPVVKQREHEVIRTSNSDDGDAGKLRHSRPVVVSQKN